MKLDIKEILWLFAMGLFYIGIGILSFIIPIIYVFSCFLGVPFSIYIYKKGINRFSLLLTLIVSLILLFCGMGNSAFMILLLLFIPSIICGLFFNKQVNLPKNIINLSIIYFLGWIGMIIIWSFIYNIKFIEGFYSIIHLLEKQLLSNLVIQYNHISDVIENMQNTKNQFFQLMGYGDRDIVREYSFARLQVKYYFYLVQYLFPVFIFIFGFFSSFLHVLFTKLILKSLEWKSPSINQLFNIGVKPLTIVLMGLILIFRVTIIGNINPALMRSIDNTLTIFLLFIFMIGILFAIYIIKNSHSGLGWKVFLAIFSVISLMINPSLYVLLGFLESVFNFRKKERFL